MEVWQLYLQKRYAWIEVWLWMFSLLFWEVLLHGVVYEDARMSFGYGLGFTLSAALILAAVFSLLPKKAGFGVTLGTQILLMVFYGSQMVYKFIFGTLYSMTQMAQGGQAVTSFWRETISAAADNWYWLLLLTVPVILTLCLGKKLRDSDRTVGLGRRLLALGGAVAIFFGMEYLLTLGGTEMFSDHYYYHNTSIATNQTAERFGLLTTFRLELMGSGEVVEEEPSYFVPEETLPPVTVEEGEPIVEETEPSYNVLPFDFDQLNTLTEDKKILAINEYCAQLSGTRKNEYTGMLSDYNLIVLCGESFDTGAIHPEVTPTLYKLSQEGIVFENYYNSFPNTTTDGEYALLQGLYPDTTRTKGVSSLFASSKSHLPFALGNAFKEQKNVVSWGYHNYKGDYYGRDQSHPNMGYTMRFADDGMTFTNSWPASDLEMLQQSVDDYIGQEQFNVYYMTFSGHYRYDVKTNAIAAGNWDAVKDLPYSNDTIKAYLSCHVELDKAMEYLLQRLEEQGIADKTAIVIAGDHFPYGLSDAEYSELIGYKIDDFSKYKSSLIFWVGGLEENIVVEEYCCNVDVLPTILNLWGMEYDSRMLAGTDVFSDSTHVAVLADKSWLTDKVWFNANTGEVRYLTEESGLPEGYIETMNRRIATRYSISADILNTAYYNFVFGKEMVKVGRYGWSK